MNEADRKVKTPELAALGAMLCMAGGIGILCMVFGWFGFFGGLIGAGLIFLWAAT